MSDTTITRDVAVTLHKEIWLPESNRWKAGRTDLIQCREYDLNEFDARLIDCDTGHDCILVDRDNIAGLVMEPPEGRE